MKHKMLISIIVILFKFLAINNLYSQEIKPLVRIPFTTNGKQTYLEVQINGSKESLCFGFDTGAGSTVLDKESLLSSNIKLNGEKEDLTTSSEVVQVDISTNNKINLNGFEMEGIKFYMANLSHLKPSTNGKKVVGVIGFDMLKNYVSYINHEENYIELYPQGTSLYPKAKQLPFYLYEDVPVFRATIQTENGKEYPVQLVFDSGAGFTSSLGSNFVYKHTLDNDLKVKIKIPVIGGNASSNATNYLSSLKKISFGGFTFDHIPVNFSTSTSGALATDSIDGVIGFEMIKRFNTVIDYENKIIKLIPNKYYTSAFDFNLTGLNFRNKENQIIVSNVLDFSPAKNAGIKQDDIIISVDNKKFTTSDTLKNYLKNSYRSKKFKIKRDNHIMTITIKPKKFY